MLTFIVLVLPALPFIGMVLWGVHLHSEWTRSRRHRESMSLGTKLRSGLLFVLLMSLFFMSFAVYDMVQPAAAEGLSVEPEITISVPASGMAPLRVFADALNSTRGGMRIDGSVVATVDTVDYRSLRFEWDFGDGRGTPQSGGNMCASHVYELEDGSTPVERTVTLTITDPRTGASTTARETIMVRPFEGTTFYFDSELGDDRRSPKEARDPATPWKSVRQAELAIRAHRQGAIRVLFRRGQTFPVVEGMAFKGVSGDPLIVWGAYGEGPAPILDAREIRDQNFFQLNGRCHNWVFSDLQLVKAGHPILEPGAGGDVWDLNGDVPSNTAAQNLLFLRCKALGGGTTITTYRTVHDPETHEHQFRDITVADCDFRNTSSMILYIGGERISVTGSVLKANGSQHLLRFWYLGRAVIQNNQCEDVCLDQSQGKLRSVMRILAVPKKKYASALPTRHVIVSGNVFQMGSGTQCFDIAGGSDDIDTNGRTQHIIFEKNRLVPSVTAPKSPKAFWDLVADNITIRNNLVHGALFDESAYIVRCVDYREASGGKIDAPKPYNIWVLGNTIYAPHTSGKKIQLVSVVSRQGGTGFQEADAEETGNLVVRNNIAIGSPKSYRREVLTVYSSENSMRKDGQVVADHNVIGVDEILVAPRMGRQLMTTEGTNLRVGDRVYGLVSGASGVVEAVDGNQVTLRGVWSGRPFPATGHGEFDGKDGLYNITRKARCTVVSASEIESGDDFSLAPGSSEAHGGGADSRLFEDFFGRPRPGSFGRSGKPTMGAVEP